MIPVHIFLIAWILFSIYGYIKVNKKIAKCETNAKELKLDKRITTVGVIIGIVVYVFCLVVYYTDWIYK